MMHAYRTLVARRRRARRDTDALRLRDELRELVERAQREAEFRAEAQQLLRDVAHQSPAVRAGVAILEYGQRAAREAS